MHVCMCIYVFINLQTCLYSCLLSFFPFFHSFLFLSLSSYLPSFLPPSLPVSCFSLLSLSPLFLSLSLLPLLFTQCLTFTCYLSILLLIIFSIHSYANQLFVKYEVQCPENQIAFFNVIRLDMEPANCFNIRK